MENKSEKPKFYTIKASLVRCSRQDFFDSEGFFLENKLFFIKDYVTKEFVSHYVLPMDFTKNLTDRDSLLSKKYTVGEINNMLRHGLIYKIVETSNVLDFNFSMYIRTANEFDLFYNFKNLQQNVTYYNINYQGMVSGPFHITSFTKIEEIKKLMDQGLVLVPNHKQKFEQITLAKAS